MLVRLKFFLAAGMTVALLAANLGIASAHQWCAGWPDGCFHWNKGGSQIVIQNWNYAANHQAAENARADGWNKIGILYNYSVPYHTDISVFDGNFGSTGWAGLASIEGLDFDWGCACWAHINHAHARYNSYYGGSQQYIQGVFCQEIAHGWGLDHSNTGDCMGLGYYAGSTSYYGPHNNTDFYNIYRFH